MPNTVLVRLGARIKMIRLQKNLTQFELANMCAIEKSNMSRIEAGLGNPTVVTLIKISDALEVSVEEFFRDELSDEEQLTA